MRRWSFADCKAHPDAVACCLWECHRLQLWSVLRSAAISTVPTVENVSDTA